MLRAGRVTEFDQERGTGVVVDETDRSAYPFHSTSITDGTRSIEVGRSVVFRVQLGQLGRTEAAEVMPR